MYTIHATITVHSRTLDIIEGLDLPIRVIYPHENIDTRYWGRILIDRFFLRWLTLEELEAIVSTIVDEYALTIGNPRTYPQSTTFRKETAFIKLGVCLVGKIIRGYWTGYSQILTNRFQEPAGDEMML